MTEGKDALLKRLPVRIANNGAVVTIYFIYVGLLPASQARSRNNGEACFFMYRFAVSLLTMTEGEIAAFSHAMVHNDRKQIAFNDKKQTIFF
jgi:hypothetical protein